MFIVQAPHPALEATTLLPNPQFGDGENLTDEVQVKRAMDGTLYTYVKTKNDRRHLQWSFRLSRNKGLELRAFILAYYAKKIRVTDHNERVWVGNFINNPFEFDTPSRAAPAIAPMPRGETQEITIEFEGVEQ
jgi:hypothetical protein